VEATCYQDESAACAGRGLLPCDEQSFCSGGDGFCDSDRRCRSDDGTIGFCALDESLACTLGWLDRCHPTFCSPTDYLCDLDVTCVDLESGLARTCYGDYCGEGAFP
jgi:hypothetical protein